MSSRKPVGKKLRFEVFKRDFFTCQYCGATPPSVVLQVDHILAVAEGGSNDIDNLVTSCQPCNIGKGARSLTDIPRPLKERMNEIKEREDQLAAYNGLLMEIRERKDEQSWEVARALTGIRTLDRYSSARLKAIGMFLERLPFADVLQAAEMAESRVGPSPSRFSYFCGICWRVIKEGWL